MSSFRVSLWMSDQMLLKDCCDFQEGYVNPSQDVPEYFGGSIKWLRASDLNGGFVYDTERKLSEAGYKSAGKSASMFPAESLAISKSGTIGALGILKSPMCGNRAVINIRVKPDKADLHYIFYTLKNSKEILLGKTGGSIQKNLYVSALETLPLLHDKQNDQRSIGGMLAAIDAKIDLNNRINTELEALAKTIYDYWFVQFDFPDANGRPYKSSGGAMVWNDTLKREIPVEWRVVSLGELVNVVKEGIASDGADTTTPYVGLEHIARKSIVLSEWSTADQAASQKIVFRSGDILFGKIRPYFHKVALASIDGIASTDAIIMRPKRPEVSGLVLETVFAERFVAMATASSTGSKMPRADWNVMRRYGVAIPDEHSNTLSKYQDLFGPIADKIGLHVRQNRELTQLRDWLLPMLMNGQVRVA